MINGSGAVRSYRLNFLARSVHCMAGSLIMRDNSNVTKFRLKTLIPKEDQEQIVAATWLTKNNIPFYHIPNGGKRNAMEGVKFKRMGVKAGVPDICIPLARKGYHGLYIELKRQKGGVLSESQAYWRDLLRRNGYDWFLAEGADELIKYVKDYIFIRQGA